MKKIILLGGVLALLFSCKKENEVAPTTIVKKSMEEQVAALIQQADPDLYARIYNGGNQTKTSIGVKLLPGIFYIPSSGLDNATCLGTDNVCMVVVSSTRSMENGLGLIGSNADETYDPASTKLIINNGPTPVVKSLSSLKTHTNENGSVGVQFN